jgi:hypothetical protein
MVLARGVVPPVAAKDAIAHTGVREISTNTNDPSSTQNSDAPPGPRRPAEAVSIVGFLDREEKLNPDMLRATLAVVIEMDEPSVWTSGSGGSIVGECFQNWRGGQFFVRNSTLRAVD